MEFPGGGGSTARPSGTENPGGWGGQTGKTLRGGGMDIFWNHTLKNFFWKQASKSGCKLYTGAHHTRVNTVYGIQFIF